MGKVRLADPQRDLLAAALEDAKELEAQIVEAEQAGLATGETLAEIRRQIVRLEDMLRIF